MGAFNATQVNANMNVEDLANLVARLIKEIQFLTDGNISTSNVREISGWLVNPKRFVSKDGDVGFSTEDTGGDDIRIFAGPDGLGSYYYIVTKSGKLYATDAFITGRIEGSVIVGSEIMTAEVGEYPRSEMSSAETLFAAYQSATNYVKLSPDAFGSTPGFTFVNGVSTQALLYLLGTTLALLTPAGSAEIQISSGKDLKLSANTASGYATYVNSWGSFKNSNTGQTLQQALDAISSSIGNGDYAVITYSGGVATSGRSLIASDIPTLPQSKITGLPALQTTVNAITLRTRIKAYQSVSQTFLAGTQTIIQYDTEVMDALNEYNAGTNVFTPTVSGTYSISAAITYNTVTAGYRYTLDIYINGLLDKRLKDDVVSTASFVMVQGTSIIELTAGDAVTIRADDTAPSGSFTTYAQSQHTYLEIVKIA